jgi:hypothetical protein
MAFMMAHRSWVFVSAATFAVSAGVARDGKDEKTAPTEAIGSILAGDREGKMETLV